MFASYPDHSFTAAELADDVAFTKRAVEQELEGLQLAGVVAWTVLHGRRRFQVARRDDLLAFVGSRPRWVPRWIPLIRVLLGGLHLVIRLESSPPIVRSVESDKYLRESRADIMRAGLAPPDTSAVGIDRWRLFEAWLRSVTSALAAGDPGVFARTSLTDQQSVPEKADGPQ